MINKVKVYGLVDFLIDLRHLPAGIMNAVKEVNGKNMSLEELIDTLGTAAETVGGRIGLIDKSKLVVFSYKGNSNFNHYAVLRYR